MTVTVLPDLLQGTDEWFDQRRGMVTASVVGQLLTVRKPTAIDFACPSCQAPAQSPCLSKREPIVPIKTLHGERTAYASEHADEVESQIVLADDYESRSLIASLAAERVTNWTDPVFTSFDMWRGVEDEPRARDVYSEHFAPVTEVGFMVRQFDGFRIGYSPDGLVGDDGLIEVKSRKQKTQFLTVANDEVPNANMAQLQCGLLVSGRQWIDYCSFSGGMPFWRKRVYPDARWFAAIEEAARTAEVAIAEMTAKYEAGIAGMPMTERIIHDEIRI